MPDSDVVQLTEGRLRRIVREGVTEALTTLGVDAGDPLEMQKDFQHLRSWRLATAKIRGKAVLTVVTVVVTGACAALWLGIKGSIG